MDLTKFWFNTAGVQIKNRKINNRICVLLTSLSDAFSQENNCVLAQAGIRVKKKQIVYQHLSKLTIESTYAKVHDPYTTCLKCFC